MKDIIQCYIMSFGIWEPNLTNFLERRLSSGDIFIDIGANIGYFTLLASRLVGKTGAVIAIEAAPHIFHALEENLARNNVQNARAVPVAVAAEHGTVGLYSGGIDNLGATTMIPTRGHGPVLLQVEADRLDKIVTPLELSRARIIKIDIEGAELPPLETLIALASQLRDDVEIVVELSPQSLREAGSSVEEIFAAFLRKGFHAYDLQNSYDLDGYIERHVPTPPRRIRNVITEQSDIVFSHEDVEEL